MVFVWRLLFISLAAVSNSQSYSHSYKLYNLGDGLNWIDAQKVCHKDGLELAYIKTEDSFKEVELYLDKRDLGNCVWIGLRWSNLKFTWLDNELLSWTRWDAGEPNCMNNDCTVETCVLMSPTLFFRTSNYNDIKCNALCDIVLRSTSLSDTMTSTLIPPSITETITSTIRTYQAPLSTYVPGNQPSIIQTHTAINYYLIKTDVGVNHGEARYKCQSHGLDLAMIKDEYSYNLLLDYLNTTRISKDYTWIGLIWNVRQQLHVWLDNEPMSWSKWMPPDPNCMGPPLLTQAYESCPAEENCVVMTTSFDWVTISCGHLCDLLCASDKPSVQIQQSSYSVTTATSVTLVCTVTSALPVISVYWQKNIVGTTTTITSTTNANKYTGSTFTTPSLTIYSVEQSDVGEYTCFASNSVGTGQSLPTTLSIIDTPSVQIQQSSYSVTTATSVTLVCTVTSSLSVISVYWQKDNVGKTTTITSTTNANKYIGSTVTTPSLTIYSVEQSDVGEYTCFASNSVGTGQSLPTTLSIIGYKPSVQIPQSSYSVTTATSVTLVCTVTSSLSVINVYWQKNIVGTTTTITSTTNANKYIGSTVTTPSLTIYSVEQSDVGEYTCFASNSVGTGQSLPTTLSIIGDKPSVQIQQSSYSVTTATSVTLVCTVTSSLPVISVYWQKNIVGTTTTITSTTNANKYTGSTFTTPSLTIYSVEQIDVGEYTCFASNNVGTGQSLPTTLSVEDKPSVQIQQSSYSVTTATSVTLVCTVTSSLPVISVYWQKNIVGTTTTITSTTNANKYIGSTVTTPSLTIYSVEQSDVGEYTCFASNSVGTGQSLPTTLSIIGDKPSVQIQQSSYSVTTATSVTLVCTVTSSLPVISVYWQKNIVGTTTTITSTINANKYIGSTVTTPSLTIYSVEQSDVGEYTCFASNSVGTGQSLPTTLSIIGDKPSVQIQQSSYSVTTATSVTLVCTVTSSLSVISVYWQKNIVGTTTTITSTSNVNKYIGSSVTTPSLTIYSVEQSDVGEYTCFASNSVGTGQSLPTTLSIIGDKPSVQIQQSSYSVTTATSLTLVCTVTSALPVISVYWQKNIVGTTTTITSTTNANKYIGSTVTTPSLTIYSVEQSDVGEYTCFASNSVGTGQSLPTTLSIIGYKPSVQIEQSSYSVTTATSVTLVCTVTSSLPVISVYWQKNIVGTTTTITSTTNAKKYIGSTVTTPSLTIYSVEQSDVGEYTCFASNSVGTGQSLPTTLNIIAQTNTSTVRPKKLLCKCSTRKINTKWHFLDGANITNEEVKEIVLEDFKLNTEKNITVNTKSLSQVKQKLISIKDERPTSQTIGWVAMLLVAVPCIFIVSIDIIDMIRYLSRRNIFVI